MENRISAIEKRLKLLENEKKIHYFSGIGFDSHRFDDSKSGIILGNIKIPFSKGVKSHSDGDVLLHAVIDAILGAAALRDIGTHFPDTDEQFKDADSAGLLEKTILLAKNAGYEISNIDTVVIMEQPKLSAYNDEIRSKLAEITGVKKDNISIKGKTAEGMGLIGEGMGIAVFASVLLTKHA